MRLSNILCKADFTDIRITSSVFCSLLPETQGPSHSLDDFLLPLSRSWLPQGAAG